MTLHTHYIEANGQDGLTDLRSDVMCRMIVRFLRSERGNEITVRPLLGISKPFPREFVYVDV